MRLYYRSGCSLCEDMHGELLAAGDTKYDFDLEAVDIDSSDALVSLYHHKVPVLTDADGYEICHYFLDSQALDSYFATH